MESGTPGHGVRDCGLLIAAPVAQDPGARGTPTPGARGGGGRPGGGPQAQGTLTPMVPDSRGWGWQVKASVSPSTPRPFYNKAKELLFQDQQVTSYTISSFNTDLYCEVASTSTTSGSRCSTARCRSTRCGA